MVQKALYSLELGAEVMETIKCMFVGCSNQATKQCDHPSHNLLLFCDNDAMYHEKVLQHKMEPIEV